MKIALAVALITIGAATACAEWVDMGEYRVTAYCHCAKCCGKTHDDPAYGIAADGTDVRTTTDTTFAAPRNIPLGAIIWVDGIGQGVAHDRGGAIRGSRLDYYRPTHQEALNWGVQHKRVWIWRAAQ